MSTQSVEQVIGRAIGDSAFRELLLSNPDQALAGLDLTAAEIESLKGLKANDIALTASELEPRVSKSMLVRFRGEDEEPVQM